MSESQASAPELVPISVNGRHWDPTVTYADDAARTNYITITLWAPLEPQQSQDLLDLGVEIQERVDTNTYLCRYEPKDLQQIREISCIRQADVFRSKFKVVRDLKTTTVAATEGVCIPIAGLSSSDLQESTTDCTVDIMLHPGIEASSVIQELSNEAQVDPESIDSSSRKLRMIVDRSRLKLLATHDCVRAIEEVFPKTVHNNYAREIMEADVMVNDTTYLGEGQTVTVSDTGFDTGDMERCHPAFSGRVLCLRPIIRQPKGGGPSPDLTNDPIGHGTHVCGSILGQSMVSEIYSEGSTGGVARHANLVVQSLFYFNPETGAKEPIRAPHDLSDDLFDPPYKDNNSRIFNNSWGDTWDTALGQRAYSKNGSEEVDEFVWRTKDAVVLFSAGNDNLKPSTKGKPAIGAQAAAKNCITVGATGSSRSVEGKGANLESMYPDSSWGPTREGRIKPDVVAPGVNILSTCTQHPYPQKLFKNKGKPYDPLFEIKSGTSMATPLVAGCTAILREVLVKHGSTCPPAALVKALIINGAVRLPGIPIEAQGFGRVNLTNSVAMATASRADQAGPRSPSGFHEGSPLKQGQKAVFEIKIPQDIGLEAKKVFKVTLAYSDVPGVLLQNNLNLVVLAGGVEKHGNGFEGDTYDEVNNVEQIVWEGVSPGVIEVIVWARKITPTATSDGQAFALAWSTL